MVENEFVFRVPYSLGTTEAKKRISSGIEAAKAQFSYLHNVETRWDGNKIDFRLSALAQTVAGSVEVDETYVELRAQLPFVIRMLAKRFLPIVESTGKKLLR